MKIKLLWIILISILLTTFVACGHHSNKTESASGDRSPSLVLNKGEKWKIESSMKKGMDSFYKIIANFNRGSLKKSLNDYNKMGETLDTILQDVTKVSKNSEDGAHREFHKLLEVLIVDVNRIKGATELKVSENYYQKVKEDFENYFFFFEY